MTCGIPRLSQQGYQPYQGPVPRTGNPFAAMPNAGIPDLGGANTSFLSGSQGVDSFSSNFGLGGTAPLNYGFMPGIMPSQAMPNNFNFTGMPNLGGGNTSLLSGSQGGDSFSNNFGQNGLSGLMPSDGALAGIPSNPGIAGMPNLGGANAQSPFGAQNGNPLSSGINPNSFAASPSNGAIPGTVPNQGIPGNQGIMPNQGMHADNLMPNQAIPGMPNQGMPNDPGMNTGALMGTPGVGTDMLQFISNLTALVAGAIQGLIGLIQQLVAMQQQQQQPGTLPGGTLPGGGTEPTTPGPGPAPGPTPEPNPGVAPPASNGLMSSLAQEAEKSANNRGTTGMCLAGVQDALDAAGLKMERKPSAYMLAADFANDSRFEEIDGGDLSNLPAGAIVVWDKGSGANQEHGHISVALGGGREASDHIAKQITNYGTKARVFIPKG